MIEQFPNDTHPMGVTSAMLSSLTAFYPEYVTKTNLSDGDITELYAKLMGEAKVIISQFYRKT